MAWARRLSRPVRGPLLVLVLATTGVAALFVLVGPLAWRVGGRTVAELAGKDRADAINSVRQILLAGAAGLIAVGGLVFTARNYNLSRRGQVTDRYTKAIALLASEKDAERVGGIYALEHIMVESARDHATVVDVLAAFIRQRSPAPPTAAPTVELNPRDEGYAEADQRPMGTDKRKPPADVQAALTVLARRPFRAERNPLDLRRTDLSGAELSGARLAHFLLTGSHLRGADLFQAQLQYAYMRGAQLQGADLRGAQLQDAYLVGAQLQGAYLGWAQLQGANLTRAQMHEGSWRSDDPPLVGDDRQDWLAAEEGEAVPPNIPD